MDELQTLWSNLKESVAIRSKRITEIEALGQFLLEASMIESWITLHSSLMSVDVHCNEDSGLRSILKTHQNLQEEIKAYQSQIETLEASAEDLAESDKASDDVVVRLFTIKKNYQQLLELVQKRHHRLMSLQQFFAFLSDVDTVVSLANDKIVILKSITLPNELNEAEIMMKRLEGIQADLDKNADRYHHVQEQSEELLESLEYNLDEIEAMRDNCNETWNGAHTILKEKVDCLHCKIGFLKLCFDIDSTTTWITVITARLRENVPATTDSDATLKLQSELNAVERDSAAAKERMTAILDNYNELPDLEEDDRCQLDEKLQNLQSQWDDLSDRIDRQCAIIGDCSDYQRLLIDIEDFLDWISKALQEIDHQSDHVPLKAADAEMAIKVHEDLQAEIESHVQLASDINEKSLPYLDDENEDQQLKTKLTELNHNWQEFLDLYEKHKKVLQERYEESIFYGN
ncbi:uncharacterized protein TRIADDRAFT_62826, partial [Trichoplax adhaerens]